MATPTTTSNLNLVILFWFLSAIVAAKRTLHSVNNSNISMLPTASITSICESMVVTQGYSCQEHHVTTQDGYILSLQRIPASKSGKIADKPPVLLQHGLTLDGSSWLLNPPAESLAFILADNGYDVWIGNTRGTRFSSGHTSLSPSDPAYWDWSWSELSAYDVPANFQYVQTQTRQKIYYIGHSLGTLMALTAFSKGTAINMLRAAALLCPVAHINHIPPSLSRAAAELFLLEESYWFGQREFIPGEDAAAKLLQTLCIANPLFDCSNLLTAFTGVNCCIKSATVIDFLGRFPQPTSIKNMIHLAQMIRTGSIAKFDYGVEGNKQHYNQSTPPTYEMASIPKEVPLFLGYGSRDTLSDVNDVQLLLNDLKDHKLTVLLRQDYAHLDFVFGSNANQVIYSPIMDFFKLN